VTLTMLRRLINCRIIIIFLMPTSTKPVGVNIKKSVSGCNGDSFGGHCVLKGDRVPLLKGHGQALEQKHCFLGIFSDGCDVSDNLLNEFDGQAVPCACCIIIICICKLTLTASMVTVNGMKVVARADAGLVGDYSHKPSSRLTTTFCQTSGWLSFQPLSTTVLWQTIQNYIKLYCFVTEANVCGQLSQNRYVNV